MKKYKLQIQIENFLPNFIRLISIICKEIMVFNNRFLYKVINYLMSRSLFSNYD